MYTGSKSLQYLSIPVYVAAAFLGWLALIWHILQVHYLQEPNECAQPYLYTSPKLTNSLLQLFSSPTERFCGSEAS